MTTDAQHKAASAPSAPRAARLPPVLFLLAGLPPVLFLAAQAWAIGRVERVATGVVLYFVAFAMANGFVPRLAPLFERRGLFGMDINKKGSPEGDVKIPEALGLVPATVYIMCLCLLHVDNEEGGINTLMYTAALASVTFMILLGFSDDVLDLKWRYKLVLPLVGCLPLLANYTGHTTVIVPKPLRFLLDGRHLISLGYLYHLYMALLSIFCTNAINIYAGINGIEVGQSVVIGIFVLFHAALQLNPGIPKESLEVVRANNFFAADLMLPFVGAALGLLRHNGYPSVVFVGDTFCYFAGMCFAMTAILGHFSETLLLFFIPQIINFLYSLPQLFGIIPCPRHRLPKYNTETKKLEAVKSHLTLINLVLLITGPMTEKNLCILLVAFQVVCCAAGYTLRILALKYLL